MRLRVVFYRTTSGKEPVREWLKSLSREDRKRIGETIKIVQFGWPLGMPLIRKMDRHLWEVRCSLDKKTARVFFTIEGDLIILLHGFIKKSQKTPKQDIALARQRAAKIRE